MKKAVIVGKLIVCKQSAVYLYDKLYMQHKTQCICMKLFIVYARCLLLAQKTNIHFGFSASCSWLAEKQTFTFVTSLLVVLGWQKNKHFTLA